MKLKVIKDHTRLLKKGDVIETHSKEQQQYLIDNGIAEKMDKETTVATESTTSVTVADKADKKKA